MPVARAEDGTRLHYDVAGGGLGAPAVLLIMGLTFRGDVWGETRDALAAAGYRTITFDNRGAGESASLTLRFSTSTLADDAIAVMRAAFAERAHIVGVSLGGMIAQEVVLRHPRRVGALVLQSTSAGRPALHLLAPALPIRSLAMARARAVSDRDRRARIALRILTTRSFARQADLSDAAVRALLDAVEEGVTLDGYLGQVRAVWGHRAWRRLHRIRAPTLVQHGTRDGIIRAAAARAIARRIPGAELQVYEGAGHVLAVQRPESITALQRFLGAHDGLLPGHRASS